MLEINSYIPIIDRYIIIGSSLYLLLPIIRQLLSSIVVSIIPALSSRKGGGGT